MALSEPLVPAGRCCVCGCSLALPASLGAAARRSYGVTIFCPYGHEQFRRYVFAANPFMPRPTSAAATSTPAAQQEGG